MTVILCLPFKVGIKLAVKSEESFVGRIEGDYLLQIILSLAVIGFGIIELVKRIEGISVAWIRRKAGTKVLKLCVN